MRGERTKEEKLKVPTSRLDGGDGCEVSGSMLEFQGNSPKTGWRNTGRQSINQPKDEGIYALVVAELREKKRKAEGFVVEVKVSHLRMAPAEADKESV